MNYILLANPKEWKSYHPNAFDIHKKVSYKIHTKNKKYLSEAKVGEKALLIVTGGISLLKFEAVVSVISTTEVEFSFVRTINPVRADILRCDPYINEVLFTKSGNFKQNSVFAIEDFLYYEIISISENHSLSCLKNYSNYEHPLFWGLKSREFFEDAIREINPIKRNNIYRKDLGIYEGQDILRVNSIKQLKSKGNNNINNQLNDIQAILDNYNVDRFCEGIVVEDVAFYKSYHNHNVEYGIYFNLAMFASYIILTERLLNKSKHRYDYYTIRRICVEEILQHERFHYLTELFITFEELAAHNPTIYDSYMYVYEQTFRTSDCFAETLANYFAKMYFKHKGLGKFENQLNEMFDMQAPGYREAKNINSRNEIDTFIQFEQQLGLNSGGANRSVMLKEVKEFYLKERLPIAKLENMGVLNVPIYILNDGLTEKDFNSLLEIVFPALIS